MESTKPAKLADEQAKQIRRKLHQTLRKVEADLERFHFNTAISAVMELTNLLYQLRQPQYSGELAAAYREAFWQLAVMLNPLAPHLAAEMYYMMSGKKDLYCQPWPKWDAKLAAEESVRFAVQVNGKLRGQVSAAPAAKQQDVEQLVQEDSKIQAHLAGKNVRKVIFVAGRLINYVVQ